MEALILLALVVLVVLAVAAMAHSNAEYERRKHARELEAAWASLLAAFMPLVDVFNDVGRAFTEAAASINAWTAELAAQLAVPESTITAERASERAEVQA